MAVTLNKLVMPALLVVGVGALGAVALGLFGRSPSAEPKVPAATPFNAVPVPVGPNERRVVRSVDQRAIVAFLADEEREGRAPGTVGETAAADFIAKWFGELGLEPLSSQGWFQALTFPNSDDGGVVHSRGNVIGWLNVGAPHTIVLGAHYDHIGHGGVLSREYFSNAVHNGADDNASGIAALLKLAELYSSGEHSAPANLVFVAFSGEEDGLYGSQALLKSGLIDPATLQCFINFDMVGRLDELAPNLAAEGTVEYAPWKAVLEAVPHPKFKLRTADPITWGSSDHCSFYSAGIPSISFSTGITDDYHKSTDDLDRLNWAGLHDITEYVALVIDSLGPQKVGLDRSALRPAPSRAPGLSLPSR